MATWLEKMTKIGLFPAKWVGSLVSCLEKEVGGLMAWGEKM